MASPGDLQRVSLVLTAHAVRDLLDYSQETGFQFWGNIEVFDISAFDTDEVVVVSREPLREFESGNPLKPKVRLNDPSFLENSQRSVQRREGDGTFEVVLEFNNGPWSGRFR